MARVPLSDKNNSGRALCCDYCCLGCCIDIALMIMLDGLKRIVELVNQWNAIVNIQADDVTVGVARLSAPVSPTSSHNPRL